MNKSLIIVFIYGLLLLAYLQANEISQLQDQIKQAVATEQMGADYYDIVIGDIEERLDQLEIK